MAVDGKATLEKSPLGEVPHDPWSQTAGGAVALVGTAVSILAARLTCRVLFLAANLSRSDLPLAPCKTAAVDPYHRHCGRLGVTI